MKYIIVLAAIAKVYSLNIQSGQGCNCTQLTYQNDCQKSNCTWNNSACVPFICSAVSSYQSCIEQDACAWTNNQCTQFTKCADYQPNNNATCEVQGASMCVTPTNGQSGNCSEKAISLLYKLPTFNCTGVEQQYCVQNEYCTFQNNQCLLRTCSLSTQAQCTYTSPSDTRLFSLCQWTGTQCQDAQNLNYLNSTICLSSTGGMYYWDSNSSKCNSCSGQQPTSSSSLIMLSIVISIFI
ncbi:hypothetical protein pb186bvf_014018 [Paramecium bursaria]